MEDRSCYYQLAGEFLPAMFIVAPGRRNSFRVTALLKYARARAETIERERNNTARG